MKLGVAMAILLTAMSSGVPALSFAQATDEAARDQRARISRERAAAEARFSERQRECQTRFVVTSCVDDAKRDHREVVARLRRELGALDEQERKAKTAARTEELRRKAEADASRAMATPDAHRHESASSKPGRSSGREANRESRLPNTVSPRTPRPPKAPSRLILGSGPKAEVRSAEDVERSRAAYETAQREAAAHRAEVEARNAARAARRKPAAPLPLPPGASAP